MATNMFTKDEFSFKWKDIQTTLLRVQYNRLMSIVIQDKNANPYKDRNGVYIPNYLDNNLCLTLEDCILYKDSLPQLDSLIEPLIKKIDNSTNPNIITEK